ncbi:purine nucleoside phosphorylase LACC1-like [Clavelina lepadiformis]|uniref:purine nucleoside phosphorylase LACC1-like n=1 Tax=Clavelina lepadiformis TaxID=159417 RepID=UPI004040FF23
METFVVIGGETSNFSKKILEETTNILLKTPSKNIKAIAFISHSSISNDILSAFKEVFSCSVVAIANHEKPYIHGLYEVKRMMDKLSILSLHLLSATTSVMYFRNLCTALFPPAYQVSLSSIINAKGCQEFFSPHNINYEIKNYISSIPLCPINKFPVLTSNKITFPFVHGYSGRQGGISTHPDQASLNLCYSNRKRDPKSVIAENKARLAKRCQFDVEKFYIAKAVHGKDVWVYEHAEPLSYDGIVTKSPGIVVAAPGADCNMILFADPVREACGAAHAGWKGILAGILQSMLLAMQNTYGTEVKDLIVSIGPSLGVCCCEFGKEDSKKFTHICSDCVVWKTGHEKPFIDLRLAVKTLLERYGVLPKYLDDGQSTNSSLDICTKCDPLKRFFSYRRDGAQFGNQVGFIGLTVCD